MRILNRLKTYKMIVLIHTIWHVITELSLPAWQKEARDITYEVIGAMKEAKKKDGTRRGVMHEIFYLFTCKQT